ncbi:MAG: monovalent cation/H+ antiporter subunit D family protein [Gammaproteobacteria bacterium]|nr:MAG: monovalent cation/H+ antiporter subunit D family protein [Gammaproteobacteria bacterium]
MNFGWQALPLYVVLISVVTAMLIFALGEGRQHVRTTLNLGGAILKLALIMLMLLAIQSGASFEFRMSLLPGLDLVLHADRLTMLFATLSAMLWLITTVYAIGYLEQSPNRARFFGFFSLCVAATMGVASAGNLFTFFIFYELLTLATWPLVVHRGTPEAFAAGRLYLAYTLVGGVLVLIGLIWLHALAGGSDFIVGGSLAPLAAGNENALRTIFVLLMLGFGVKAALLPLHSWLPRAMVAPAPVSALLHAVAVVKAGAFGLVRLVQDVFGFDLAASLGLADVLAWLAAATVIYGSVLALRQSDLKRRLAYSTVSQVSYIALGVATGGMLATVGGLVHLVHQGLTKITLFFCAGNYAEGLGVHSIEELDGLGQRMPVTSVCFTLGAFGMIGIPPLAGFVTKWYLGAGAVAAGAPWIIAVIVASTLLNAAYFLPLVHRLWFRPLPEAMAERALAIRGGRMQALVGPTVVVAAMALLAGLFAGTPGSPLFWVIRMVGGES